MTPSTTAAQTTGNHHAGLTAPDVTAASAFFENTLGFTRVGGGPTRHMMCAIPGGIRLELIAPGVR